MFTTLATQFDGFTRRAGELLARPVATGLATYKLMDTGLPWLGMAVRSNPIIPSMPVKVGVTAVTIIGVETAFHFTATDADVLDKQATKAAERLSARADKARQKKAAKAQPAPAAQPQPEAAAGS